MTTGAGQGTPITSALNLNGPQNTFGAVWYYNSSAGTWTDYTLSSQVYGRNPFSIFQNAGDFLYLGNPERFDMAAFFLNTGAGGTIGTITYGYSLTNNTFQTFIPGEYGNAIIPDDDNEYQFGYDGAVGFFNLRNWAAIPFSATFPHAVTPPDTQARYWIRLSCATATPQIKQIQMRPYAAYCTPTDVARLLNLNVDFDATTVPSRETVEDYIYAAQSNIDYRTRKSWRLNYKINEEYEFNMQGMRLMESDIRGIASLKIWNGGQWDVKTQGRNHDYFVVRDMGMVFFARYFLLPARLQSTSAATWPAGWGEFNYACRISYFYGRDINADRKEGGMVFDIARKLAAIDIITNHDYTALLVSGTDRMNFMEKVDGWRNECEERLERLVGWRAI